MSFITELLAWPLGYIMWFCYKLIDNYGLTLILFTLITKIIMFPLSIKVQKNSIAMVKINPQLNEIRMRYSGDKDKIADEQLKIYKKEGYNPLWGIIPTLIQLPIIFGLIDVIYKPMKHLLHIDTESINQLVGTACKIKGVDTLGNSAQLTVINMLKDPSYASLFKNALAGQFTNIDDVMMQLQNFKTTFLMWDFAYTPSLSSISNLIWIPILSGVSAWALCFFQNKANVLQVEQSKANQYGMTIFMIAFSVYFSFLVPAGVGFYWIIGNLLAIALIYICNAIYNPKEFIDYDSLEKMKVFIAKEQEQKSALKEKNRINKKREKIDYKKFLQDDGLRKELVFYSRKNGYYKYFAATIDEVLKKSNIEIHYITNDPDDDIFNMNEPRIIPYYISETKLVTLFMKLDVKIIAMTTQDLNQFHLKRSYVSDKVEYIYMPHYPLSETLTSRKGSLDHYDTIFCVSHYQVNEIREWEKAYGLKEKNLIETGYSFLEELQTQYDNMKKEEREHKKILIAPSWQEDNILDTCLHGILKQLLRKGFDVVVRPHPEYVKRYGVRMEQIVERYRNYNGGDLSFELDFSKSDSIYDSDLLITDWSGTAYEFAFVTKKPVVFINTPPKIKNPDYTVLSSPPMEFVLRDELGMQIDLDKIETLYENVVNLLNSKEKYADIISKIVQEHIANYGHAGEVGGQYIINRLRHKKKKSSDSINSEEKNGV